MEPKFIQHQVQKPALSPQIRQYLKLLEQPLGQLEQTIDAALEENPLLEEKSRELPDLPDTEPESSDSSSSSERSAEELRLGDSYDRLEKFGEINPGYEYEEAAADTSSLQKKKDFQESLMTKPEMLSDFLNSQLRFLDLKEDEIKIAEEIIGNIDEEGYLRIPLEEIALAAQTTPSEVERILTHIQNEMDPPGIGARNLQEALLLQLKRKGPGTGLAAEIVSQNLRLLEKRDYLQLAKIYSSDPEKIKEAAELIGTLAPKPGHIFYSEGAQTIIPDASISFDENHDGKLKIEIQDDFLPELRINPYYRRLLRNPQTDEKTRVYIREKMEAALTFLKALSLRKSTLYEITEELVKVQREFFEKGYAYLRPLRLKDISEKLGIHESTVSRAVSGKYVSTPQGLIPYRSFFSSKLETASGETESQRSMMERIRAMIAEEDKKHPLSDQEMVEKLNSEGVKIARRTVAKYRDLLKILPTHLRKEK